MNGYSGRLPPAVCRAPSQSTPSRPEAARPLGKGAKKCFPVPVDKSQAAACDKGCFNEEPVTHEESVGFRRLLKYYPVNEACESWPRSRREIVGESVIRRVFRNAEIGQEVPPQVGGVFQQPLRGS